MIPINDSKCEQCQQVIQVMRGELVRNAQIMNTSCSCLKNTCSIDESLSASERWDIALDWHRHHVKVDEWMT